MDYVSQGLEMVTVSFAELTNRTTITCMDAGKGREQDAEALPVRCVLIQNSSKALNIIYIE